MIEHPWLFAIGLFLLCTNPPFPASTPKDAYARWGVIIGHWLAVGAGMGFIVGSIR